MTARPRLAVVIPTFRRPALLATCLDSLHDQQLPPGEVEVLVVDDASGDDTPQVLAAAAQRMPGLRWTSQPVNRGPAAARNTAAAMARAPTLLFLDDDIAAAPGLLATHLALHERAASVSYGVVGLVQWLPALEVTPFMHWLDGTHLQFAYNTGLQPGPLAHPSQAFYTCNLSLSRELFEAAGGFDERFPYAAFEDIELGLRLADRGFTLHYRPEALAWHARAITLAEFCRRTERAAVAARILQTVHPQLPVDLDGMLTARRRAPWRLLLRAVAPRWPRLLGRDLRSAHYWAEVGEAWARGLARPPAT